MSGFPVPEGFSVRLERYGDTAVVIPTGELDHVGAPTLEAALNRAFADTGPRVILDLRELEFLDSGGLHALLMARHQLGSPESAGCA